MDLPYGELKTTVVGSFPLPHSTENMRRALSDQIGAGINFPCYGQLLDMNMMFLEPLAKEGCGVEIIGGNAWVTGDLKVPKKPIGLEFLRFAKDYLKENPSEKVDGVKIPITGPVTLSSVTKVSEEHNAVEYPDFILKFSDVVAEIAKGYDEHGADLITIDEPSLGYATWLGIEEDVIIKAIDKPIKALKKSLPSIHVCGDLSRVAGILLKSKAPILDHEFKGSPKNLNFYTRAALEKSDKMIAFGCVNSKPDPQLLLAVRNGKMKWMDIVESVEEIEKLILEGGRRFGLERLLIDPDCGFWGMRGYFKDDTGQKIATQKLRNMVKAAERIKEEHLGLRS